MLSSGIHRRAFLLAVLPLLAAQAPPRRASPGNSVLQHSGFSIDMAPVAMLPNYTEIVTAMERQVDITAGCGAKPDIMAFFRSQQITVVRNTGKGGGEYTAARGVAIDAFPLPPANNPVLLHELIHAMHHAYVPGGNANPDIERFYQIAQQSRLYPDADYMMSNNREYFAITGSLYLWGVIARAPYTRETLHAKQPIYYGWLGDLFGVKK
jgi:hypothetical protein